MCFGHVASAAPVVASDRGVRMNSDAVVIATTSCVVARAAILAHTQECCSAAPPSATCGCLCCCHAGGGSCSTSSTRCALSCKRNRVCHTCSLSHMPVRTHAQRRLRKQWRFLLPCTSHMDHKQALMTLRREAQAAVHHGTAPTARQWRCCMHASAHALTWRQAARLGSCHVKAAVT